LIAFLDRLSARASLCWYSTVAETRYATPRMQAFGLWVVLSSPVYGLLWTQVWPQAYESWTLRMVCVAVALPVLLLPRVPSRLEHAITAYWLTAVTLCLPGFFAWMWAQNDGNAVWSLSFAIALLLPLLMFNRSAAVAVTCLGSAIGLGLSVLVGHAGMGVGAFFSTLAVLAPMALSVYAMRLLSERDRKARMRTAQTVGAHFDHELRTPLQAIRMSAELLGMTPPGGAHSDHDETARQVVPLLLREVDWAVQTLEMVRANADPEIPGASPSLCSARSVIEATLGRLAWRSDLARSWLTVDGLEDADFQIRGNTQQWSAVMINLVRNAGQAVASAQRGDDGRIRVTLHRGHRNNRIVVEDNGTGIDKETFAHLFEAFACNGEGGSDSGCTFAGRSFARVAGISGSSPAPDRPGSSSRCRWLRPCRSGSRTPGTRRGGACGMIREDHCDSRRFFCGLETIRTIRFWSTRCSLQMPHDGSRSWRFVSNDTLRYTCEGAALAWTRMVRWLEVAACTRVEIAGCAVLRSPLLGADMET
jgi:signal transduction histidine kinase